MNKGAYMLTFLCGAIVGAVVISIYNNRSNEVETVEIPDVFEPDDENESPMKPQEEGTSATESKVIIKETMANIMEENGYKVGDHANPGTDDGPYVIGPADFGDFDDYDAISMTLLSDGILVDDRMYVVDDPENSVGTEYKKYFGVYPNDPNTVYIRNDELCCDYEIVQDLRTYEEVDAQRPHIRWSDNE